MRGNLKILLDIYKPQGVDWMGFAVSKNNPYSYHHIKPRCECGSGKRKIDNGAILTKNSHRYLNWLQKEEPQLFEWYQWLFTEINMTLNTPNQEHIQVMRTLQKYCQKQQRECCLNFSYSKKSN